jgi:hypothetical protein
MLQKRALIGDAVKGRLLSRGFVAFITTIFFVINVGKLSKNCTYKIKKLVRIHTYVCLFFKDGERAFHYIYYIVHVKSSHKLTMHTDPLEDNFSLGDKVRLCVARFRP